MGKRRPAHFTEPNPPAFDIWDARAIAESIARAAFPGEAVRFDGVEHEQAWAISVGARGMVGTVSSVALDRPVWASEAFGVELTLGTLASDDVAPVREHAHGSATPEGASSRSFTKFKPLPSTPAAEFDLALIVPDGVRAAQVEESLRRAGGELLERLELFDEFRGAGVPDGTRSLAWRLTFRHPERTLRDKEIEGRRARLLEALNQELGIKPRAS